MIALYNVFIAACNAVGLTMHGSNKEHTNTWKNTKRDVKVVEKHAWSR